jgi:hypothetical protein
VHVEIRVVSADLAPLLGRLVDHHTSRRTPRSASALDRSGLQYLNVSTGEI